MAKLPEKETRELLCRLTRDEVTAYSEDLARITTLQAEAEDQKKATMSSFKDKIDRFVADMRTLARKISTREELRNVECRYEYSPGTTTVTLYRTDTGEVIEARMMTPAEMQMELPGTGLAS